jgi:hypothetical protein
MRRSLRIVLVALAMIVPGAPAAAKESTLPLRLAQPADDAVLSASGWAEEWRVLAFDPATHGYVAISFVSGPIPMFAAEGRQGGQHVAAERRCRTGCSPSRGRE